MLIVFGAGASFGARDEPRPPLGTKLLEYVHRYLELHRAEPLRTSPLDRDEGERARSLIQTARDRGESFETMVNRVRQEAEYPAYDESLRELTLAVVGALHHEPVCLRVDEAFAPRHDLYDSLVSLVLRTGWSKEDASFLSLNYDLLLEGALKRVAPDPRTDYPSDLTVALGWRLYKPHGSVNWCAGVPMPEFRHSNEIAVLSPTGIKYPLVSRTVPPSEMAGHRTYAPVLAHYARSKPGDVNREQLESVCARGVEEAGRSTHAIVIGVHIPDAAEDDPPLMETLGKLCGKRVLYIAGPGATADASAAEKLGFEALQIGFAEAGTQA